MSSLPKTIATFAKNKRESVHVTLSEYKGTNLIDAKPSGSGSSMPERGRMNERAIPLPLDVSERDRLKRVLKLAEAENDRFHIRALRLALKAVDDRARAARRHHRGRR